MNDASKTNDVVSDNNPKVVTTTKRSELPAATHVRGITNNLATLDLTTKEGMLAFETFAEQYIRSDKSGLKSKADVLSIFCRAQDLGLPFTGCAEHIHVINGKTGIDIHIIKALLSRAACYWECLRDYQALYEYTDGFNVFNENNLPEYCVRCNNSADAEKLANDNPDSGKMYVYPVRFYKDLNGNTYRDYQLNSKQFQVIINKNQVAEVTKNGKIPVYRVPNQPIDYITTYKLYRKVDGVTVTSTASFTYNEAVAAGFFEKDTYKKYAKIMIGHRAFTLAARDIASDLLLGCMETTELKQTFGIPIDVQDIKEVETELVNEE